MAWPEFKHSNSRLDKAGRDLAVLPLEDIGLPQHEETMRIIGEWREAHSFPLNAFYDGLQIRAKEVYAEANVVHRLKRVESIHSKLRAGLKRLFQMQDMAGCRAIVGSTYHARQLFEGYQSGDMVHGLERADDYTTIPKDTGYSGFHLVFKYKSQDKETACFDGRRVEIQLRSSWQHAWATTVEIVDTIRAIPGETLKRGTGDPRWSRFFALMGSVISCSTGGGFVPGTHEAYMDLRPEVKALAQELGVQKTLKFYNDLVLQLPSYASYSGFHYFLIQMRPRDQSTFLAGYPFEGLALANRDYLEAEKNPELNVVLVAASDLDALAKAYPNYWLNSELFLTMMTALIAD